MKKQERKKWLGLVNVSITEYWRRDKHKHNPDLEDLEEGPHTCHVMCSLCKYADWQYDAYCCNHPLDSIGKNDWHQIRAQEEGTDCWGFRPNQKFDDVAKDWYITATEAELAYESVRNRYEARNCG